MKRSIIMVCLLVAGVLLVVQYAAAEIGAGCGQGCKGQNRQGQQQPLDAEAKKKYEKFLQETAELRRELGEKQAAYQSLMASENPDPSQAVLLTEEYFQLRDFLIEKAMLAGLVERRGGCNGCNGKSGVACGLPAPGRHVEKTN